MRPSRPGVAPARSRRTLFALWLDGLLLLLILLIESPRITGVAWHEVLGVAIAVPVLVHVLLSWHWILSKAKRCLASGTTRTRFNYLINAVLFVLMVVVILSGAVVSRVVLPSVGVATVFDRDWFDLHDAASTVLFFAVGLHLAMNWGWVVAVSRRRALSLEEREANE
jgi:hypothetical protein